MECLGGEFDYLCFSDAKFVIFVMMVVTNAFYIPVRGKWKCGDFVHVRVWVRLEPAVDSLVYINVTIIRDDKDSDKDGKIFHRQPIMCSLGVIYFCFVFVFFILFYFNLWEMFVGNNFILWHVKYLGIFCYFMKNLQYTWWLENFPSSM